MLYKLETTRESIEGYDGHYNHWPSNRIEEITVDEYFELLESYSWQYVDTKQPIEPLNGEKFRKAESHIIEYRGESFGIMMARGDRGRKFFKFGSNQKYNQHQIAMFSKDG